MTFSMKGMYVLRFTKGLLRITLIISQGRASPSSPNFPRTAEEKIFLPLHSLAQNKIAYFLLTHSRWSEPQAPTSRMAQTGKNVRALATQKEERRRRRASPTGTHFPDLCHAAAAAAAAVTASCFAQSRKILFPLLVTRNWKIRRLGNINYGKTEPQTSILV